MYYYGCERAAKFLGFAAPRSIIRFAEENGFQPEYIGTGIHVRMFWHFPQLVKMKALIDQRRAKRSGGYKRSSFPGGYEEKC